ACNSVCGGVVAKVPEEVGDRAGGQVGESDHEGLATVGRDASKGGRGHNGSGARHRIGAIAVISRSENDGIAETAGACGTEADLDVSGAKASQTEGGSGE